MRSAPDRFSYLLVKTLRKFASAPAIEPPKPAGGKKFRDEWPFLSDPGCPDELKVLANDKITAWHNFRRLHEQLFSCTSLDACFETAKNLLENFEQNRQITAEFAHYKEHHRILGKHPVFKHSDNLRKYRSLSIVALTKEEKRLTGAVWRIESEIRKGDKPHLEEARTARLERKRSELAYVRTLIDEYGQTDKKKHSRQ